MTKILSDDEQSNETIETCEQFTVTDQRAAAADATISIASTTPSEFWRELAEQLDEEICLAALSLTDGCVDPGDYRVHLYDEGVTALDGYYASVCANVVDLVAGAHEHLSDLTAEVGSGQTAVNLRSKFEDILNGPVALLRLAEDVCPSIEVHVLSEFVEVRRDQRERVCRLVAELARAADIRLVTSGLMQRWLRQNHRGRLPTFSPVCKTQQGSSSILERVEPAREELDPDSTEVAVLRSIADEPGETLSYATLRSTLPVSAGRVSQVLDRLEDLELVERFGPRNEKQVELTKTGSAFLDSLDADIGRQAELDFEFSDTRELDDNVRVTPGSGKEGNGPANRGKITRVRDLGRTDAIATHATAVENGIGLDDRPVSKLDDARTPLWHYDTDADRLTIAAEYHQPHQFLTCVARSLAHGRTFNRILTPERLDGPDGNLGALDLDDPHLLRSVSCMGWLKDKDATGANYADRLNGAREDLLDLTRLIHRKVEADEGSECGELYSKLSRNAKGLIGTMLQLLRLADVEVEFQVRLPRFNQDYADDRREQLVTMLSGMVGIGSSYRYFSVQRQLFEGREDKRNSAITPEVDATDPYGELMPSVSIAGPGVTQLLEPLESAFNRLEPHDDAPELAVRVPIKERTGVRSAYAEAVRKMCRAKDLRPTRGAVTLLSALCDSPYDAVDALHSLGKETKNPGRPIRAHDIRYALSTLSPKRILPDLRPTVGKIVSGLLGVDRRVTQSELAELADISAWSIRNNRELLETVTLLDVTDDGYRLALSFPDERREDVIPGLVASSMTTVSDVAYELLMATIEDVNRLADPDDPLGECLFWPPDVATLCDRATEAAPWIRLAAALLDDLEVIDPPDSSTEARLGPTVEQTALPDVSIAD